MESSLSMAGIGGHLSTPAWESQVEAAIATALGLPADRVAVSVAIDARRARLVGRGETALKVSRAGRLLTLTLPQALDRLPVAFAASVAAAVKGDANLAGRLGVH